MTDISVLIVDDDFRVAAIHAAYVGRIDGFTAVRTAHTAADALASVDAYRPDLVLLDLYLPDEHGLAILRRLRDQPTPPDVVVVTAARDVTSVRTAMQLGAVAYLVKPFGFAALANKLGAYRDLHDKLDRIGTEADQGDVDALFGLLRGPATLPEKVTKGHSAPTLSVVRDAVRAASMDISAAEVATVVGISRTTAQRYLTYLAEHGIVSLRLRYGTTGRPENRYTTQP